MAAPNQYFVDLAALAHVDPDSDEGRSLLDGAVLTFKTLAKADIAALRGTHTHELTEDRDEDRNPVERMRSGEDLGMPIAVQAALVEAWDMMQSQDYFEVLHVEAKCVDDRWRLAGTLDRIVRLKRDITFICFGGETVTLPAGTVLILDIKTGQLRLGNHGDPIYWHGYAIQIASYAQSLPYDPDTGRRGEWGFEINQRWAIIAHLDVLGALEEGEAVCRLILVDIEAGREAGDLVVAAKRWEKRRDVFSIVGAEADDVYFSVPVAAEPEPITPATEETPCPPSIPSETDSPSKSAKTLPSFPSMAGDSSPSSPATPSSSETPSSEPFPALTSPSPTPSAIPTFPSFGNEPSPSVSEASSTSSGTPTPNTTDRPGALEVTETTATESALSPTTDSPRTGTAPTGMSNGSTGSPTATPTTTSTPEQPSSPATSSGAAADTPPASPTDLADQLGGEIVSYAEQHADDLKALAHEMETWPDRTRAALAQAWPNPSVLPTPGQVRRGEAAWTADHVGLLRALLGAAEAPFTDLNATVDTPAKDKAFLTAPAPHPDQAPIDRVELDAVLDTVRASDHLDRINGWLKEGHDNETPWSVRKMPNVVNFERTRLALRLADFCEDDAELTATVLDPDNPYEFKFGEQIGVMTAGECRAVIARIDDLDSGRAYLVYSEVGVPRIVPKVSAP